MKNNIVGLYKHNIESYNKIKEAFKTQNVVAIKHSTGTGKSYNAIQLAYDNQDKKILYVVPSNSIIEHIKEIINKNPSLDLNKDFKNVSFVTYQSLIYLKEEELKQLNIDILVLDEFHHIGAEVWGRAIDVIVDSHKNMKILGMSAYTVRDRGTSYERDMADPDGDEIFSGKIVSTYDLCDAIIDGVLPKPIYKSAYVNLRKTADELSKRAERLNHESKKYLEVTELLENINEKINNAPSTKDVFQMNIKKDGKYIYFCPMKSEKNINDINAIREETKKWLYEIGLTDNDFEFYTSTSQNQKEGLENRKAFYNDQDLNGNFVNNKLRIMFAINQYNEGVHIPELDGIIMGRSTQSDIVYFEQLGRALAVKEDLIKEYNNLKDKTIEELRLICDKKGLKYNQNMNKNKLIELIIYPVVIDLSNNIDYIRELEDNLKNQIKTSSSKNQDYIIEPSFDIDMLNDDIYDVLNYTKNKLVSTWNDYYNLAVIYYNHYNNLDIKSNFKTINGYEYDSNGYDLGIWLMSQRSYKKYNKLSDNKINMLNKIGMIWKKMITWDDFYLMAKRYYKKYGNSYIPDNYKTFNGYEYDPNGYGLGNWFRAQKRKYENDLTMSQKRIELLEDINIDWNRENDSSLSLNFTRLINYCKKNNIDINTLNYYDFANILYDNDDIEKFYRRNSVSLEELNEEEIVYSIDSIIEYNDMKKLLYEKLEELNEQEKYILIHRFSLNDEEKYILDEIGEKLGLSRERVRQIEKRALRKLKYSPLKSKTKDYHEKYDSSMTEEEKIKEYTNHRYDILIDYLYAKEEKKEFYLNSLCNYYLHITKKEFLDLLEKVKNQYNCELVAKYGCKYSNYYWDTKLLINKVMDELDELVSNQNPHVKVLNQNGFRCINDKRTD